MDDIVAKGLEFVHKSQSILFVLYAKNFNIPMLVGHANEYQSIQICCFYVYLSFFLLCR